MPSLHKGAVGTVATGGTIKAKAMGGIVDTINAAEHVINPIAPPQNTPQSTTLDEDNKNEKMLKLV